MDIEGQNSDKSVVERKVKVKTMDSQVYQMNVPSNILVSDFKKKLQEVSGTPPDRQRLICKAKLLLDEKPLDEYIQEDDQFIHLLKTQAPEQGEQPQPQRRTEADFNNTLGRGEAGPGQAGFNPFAALNGLFGNLGAPAGQTNVIHFNSMTVGPGVNIPQPQVAQPQAGRTQGAQGSNDQRPAQQTGEGHATTTRYMAANQRVNQLMGVGPTGLEFNMRNYDQMGNQLDTVTAYRLPHISNLSADLYGHQNMSHWPLLPRDQNPQNSMTVVGNYLHSLNLQINLLVPAIQRFSEVSQRESILNDPIERQRLMVLGHQLGRAFERLVSCLLPCANLLRNLRVTQTPGEFGIMISPSRPVSRQMSNQSSQPAGQPQQSGQANPQTESNTSQSNPQQRPAGAGIPQNQGQQPPNPFANLGNLFAGLGGGAGGQGNAGGFDLGAIINDLTQQINNPEGGNDQANPLGNIINQMFGGMQQPAPQRTPQPQAAQAQQPAQQPAPAQQGAQGSQVPQSQPTFSFQTAAEGPNSQTMIMTTSPGLMSTRLRDFSVSVNNRTMQEEKDFCDIVIGSLQAQELISLLSGNKEPLDTRHPDIRADVEAFIQSSGGLENAKKTFVKSTENLFLEGLRNNPNVYEGFEPSEVTKEIANKHFNGIVECIQRNDYTQDDKFSDVGVDNLGVHSADQNLHWRSRL